ncbi:MAG: SOS response-associated peptidase family protein [Bermanella sp.]
MCGRMNVIDDPNVRAFMDALGIPIYPSPNPHSNREVRPTDETLLLIPQGKDINTATMSWGIKPSWSKQLLINAKSETVSDKTTFKKAFENHRALVVCSGWYEWKDEGGKTKQKYLVQHSLKQPMFMAAVCFPAPPANQAANQGPHQEANKEASQFVTLTTAPNEKLKQVHHRMPLIIHSDEMDEWLLGDSHQALQAIHPMKSEAFQFETC